MTAPSDVAEGGIIGYVDTSSYMAATITWDMHHDDAIRVFDAAVRSGCVLIISYAVILEAIGAVRKKVTTSRKRRSGSEEERAGVDASANAAVAHMFKVTDNMFRQGMLRIIKQKRPPLDFADLCGNALDHKGRAVDDGGKMYRYRGIDAYDLVHYAFAEGAGASVIITSDAAFADIEGNDDKFGHIKVQLTGGPLIDLLGGDSSAGQPS